MVMKDPNGTPKSREEMKWAIDNGYVIPMFRDGTVTVDKLLDTADVKLAWYVPSLEAINFINFIRLCLGEEPENSNPKPHYFLVDCIFQQDNVKPYFTVRGIDFDTLKGDTVILCTREFSKSTLLTYIVLYMAANGRIPGFKPPVNYGLYVSDSMRNNVKTMMEKIRTIYYESAYLQSLFEEVRLNQDEVSMIRKPRTPAEIAAYKQTVEIEKKDPKYVPGRMKRTFAMTGLGANTGGRGSSDGLFRPVFAFLDDMVSSEADANSDTILGNIESTIESDITGGLSGNGNFKVVIGTPYNKKDPVYRRIEEGAMLPVVFPRAVKPPEGLTEAEFESVWPDRHTYQSCKREYDKAKRAKDSGNEEKMRSLMQEHYLRISSEEDRMISDKMLKWYKRSKILDAKYAYHWYMTTDFTTSGNKGSDFSGTALWAVDADKNHYLVDISLRKKELDAQYKDVLAMRKILPEDIVPTIGVEVDGGQRAHILALKDRMVASNTYLIIGRQKGSSISSEGILSRLEKGNKHWRFRLMLPLFQNSQIWLPEELKDTPDMEELLEELRYVNYTAFGSKHDDGVDLISQLGMLDIVYPSKEMTDSVEDTSAIDEYEMYWGTDETVSKPSSGSSTVF